MGLCYIELFSYALKISFETPIFSSHHWLGQIPQDIPRNISGNWSKFFCWLNAICEVKTTVT